MIKKFEKFTGIVVPLDRANVDTDAIIPKQFLKSIKRTGFGPNLFDAWRYLDRGEPSIDDASVDGTEQPSRPLNPDFILNQPRYKGAQVLLARKNFGCGSSREHAPWALLDYGIQCVIAPSFAEIFSSNCFKNGLLAVTLSEVEVDHLFEKVIAESGFELTVDLESQTLSTQEGYSISFNLDNFHKQCLLEGLDEIGFTLQYADKIKDFEKQRRITAPWLFI